MEELVKDILSWVLGKRERERSPEDSVAEGKKRVGLNGIRRSVFGEECQSHVVSFVERGRVT